MRGAEPQKPAHTGGADHVRFFFAVLTETIQIFSAQCICRAFVHLPRKEKYRPSRRTIGTFGGGRWISPDGDKLRLHLPRKEKYRPPKRVIGIFGGGRWIRTIEGIASRFTVCPLWPLGNSPICNLSEGGAGRRTRTPDLLITNQLLYQLSYTSTTPAYVS